MASANLDVAHTNDLPLAKPWPWLAAGAALILWSLAWTLIFRPLASDARILVLALGLLVAGVGVWLRHRDRQTLYVRPLLAMKLRLFLGVLFALIALGVTALLIATFTHQQKVGLHPEPGILVWLTVCPLAVGAALHCLKHSDDPGPSQVDQELGLSYGILAFCFFVGSWTLLRDPAEPTDWDSIRLFLRVGSVVCLYAAALVLARPRLRRLMLSLLFVLHFTGISSACLAAPPAPWIAQQAWMRLFRPYLEFMYLNNAYHFYAPEPGPSSYLWFRVIFTTDDEKEDFGLWYKVPQVDDEGRIQHPVALEYQRYLSMTENIAQTDPLPPELIFNPATKAVEPNPLYAIRLMLAEPAPMLIIGKSDSKQLRIPLHPEVPKTRQVNIPADGSRRLLASFARHVAHRYPTYVEGGRTLKFKSVKIYRVIHAIPPIVWYQNPVLKPTDPTLYRPYYIGNYRADGTQIDDRDPYLYWLLPILRDRPTDPHSPIKDYTRLHAGDPNWYLKKTLDDDWTR